MLEPAYRSLNTGVIIQLYIYIDNLIKAMLGGLTGIVWQDDKQVVKVIAEG